MSAQPQTQKKAGQSRRDFLRKLGVGSAAAAGVSTGAIRLDHGPVQNSQAVAPIVAAGGLGLSAAIGWTLREAEILGSDDLPEGLTAEALENEIYQAARARYSNNQSTFIDNLEILRGAEHVAYSEGKIAAIDALNDQVPEADAVDAAQEAINDYLTTVEKNYLKSWNESAMELHKHLTAIENHPDLSMTSVYEMTDSHNQNHLNFHQVYQDDYTHELADGSDFKIHTIEVNYDNTGGTTDNEDVTNDWNPFTYSRWGSHGHEYVEFNSHDLEYLRHNDWNNIVSEMDDLITQLNDEISLYVSNVYDSVQSGDLDTSQLLTPREQSMMTSDDEEFPQAISDLRALNFNTDLEREAEIHLPGPDATVYGQLTYTGDSSFSTGTIDPDEKDGTIFFTYDVSEGEGTWSDYDDGLDGGIVTFTSEPFESTLYTLETAGGEIAEFRTDDLTEEDGNWTVDVSDQLENNVVGIEEIRYFGDVDQTQYETITLENEFEIIRFTDSEGNEYEETNFERDEPHTDDNYITEEEWKAQQERHEELIEKYEDAQGGGGITIGGTSIPNELIGLGLAVAAAIGLLR